MLFNTFYTSHANLAEGDEAVVDEIGHGVDHHAYDSGHSISRHCKSAQRHEEIVIDNIVGQQPCGSKLQPVTEGKTDDKLKPLTLPSFAVAMKHPELVPQEGVDYSPHVSYKIRDPGIYTYYTLAYIYDYERHQCVDDSDQQVSDKLHQIFTFDLLHSAYTCDKSELVYSFDEL